MRLLFFISAILLGAKSAMAESSAIAWQGDLRLRSLVERNGDQESRWRERIRVRLGLEAKLADVAGAKVRLATSTDPREQDQTIGDSSEPGSKRRAVGLDLAFLKWQPKEFVSLYAGRFSQIHYRPQDSQLLFDEDIALEGIGAKAQIVFESKWKATLAAGSSYIRENYDSFLSIDQTDNMINFAQLNGTFAETWGQFNFGFGFFNFVGLQGRNFSELISGGSPGGNSEASAGVIKNPYLTKQYYVQFENGSDEERKWSVFIEWLQNGETRDPNNAYGLGVAYSIKQWLFSTSYLSIDSDAIPSAFSNSEFANGETDSRGILSKLKYQYAQNVYFQLQHSDAHLNKSDTQKSQWTLFFDANFSF